MCESEVAGLGPVFVGNRDELRRVALGIVGSPERADDVMQEAYLRLHDAEPASELRQPLGYCFRVVRNLALDHWRRAAFESELLVEEEAGEHVPAAQATPEQQAISRQYLAIFDKVLRSLPARTQQAFQLYHLGGLTQRDIGRALGLSVGLVNTLIRDATDALAHKRCVLEGAR